MAITNVLLWAGIWTPYAVVNLIPTLGNVHFVTPMMSQVPALVGEFQTFPNLTTEKLSHIKDSASRAFHLYFFCMIRTHLGPDKH